MSAISKAVWVLLDYPEKWELVDDCTVRFIPLEIQFWCPDAWFFALWLSEGRISVFGLFERHWLYWKLRWALRANRTRNQKKRAEAIARIIACAERAE